VRVLSVAFSLDWIAALRVDPKHGTVMVSTMDPPPPSRPPYLLHEREWAWLRGLPPLHISRVSGPSPDAEIDGFVARLWPNEIPPPSLRAGNILMMTLRAGCGGEPCAVLLAYSTEKQRAMYWPADLSERNLPFLDLLASHLERALENAALTADLRDRTTELTDSVAELERAQSRLVQAQKMEAIGQLAGGVAHDFNNILTVILGHASLVRSSLAPDAARRKDVDQIIAAGDRAAGITRQLLAFGRQQVQKRESMDLNRLASAMTGMLERLIGEHVRLSLRMEPGSSSVWADSAQLERVLLNLVVNARDAMPQGGEVRIVTRPATSEDASLCDAPVAAESYVVLEVCDNGNGMNEATKARIFEPFYSTKAVGRGSGLGLSVVYGIVKQSEGHILVESTPGLGSRFTILLPRGAKAPASKVTVDSTATASVLAGTILLVEDEESVREIAREFLTQSGYVVVEASNGEEALAEFSRPGRPVDLVLTDIVMPLLGGVRLAEEIRNIDSRVPIVFMSGYSREHSDPSTATSQTLGLPSPFLAKPFGPEQLIAVVAEALERSRLEIWSPVRRPGD
ncbi:MAG: ATP-binding protein, partial [Candidatus Eisenbacteria bacterium]